MYIYIYIYSLNYYLYIYIYVCVCVCVCVCRYIYIYIYIYIYTYTYMYIIYVYIYGIHHWTIFRNSFRKLVWASICSNDHQVLFRHSEWLAECTIRLWLRLTLRVYKLWIKIKLFFSNKSKTANTIIFREYQRIINDIKKISPTLNMHFTNLTKTLKFKKAYPTLKNKPTSAQTIQKPIYQKD